MYVCIYICNSTLDGGVRSPSSSGYFTFGKYLQVDTNILVADPPVITLTEISGAFIVN
jgi:hypothetical protein